MEKNSFIWKSSIVMRLFLHMYLSVWSLAFLFASLSVLLDTATSAFKFDPIIL